MTTINAIKEQHRPETRPIIKAFISNHSSLGLIRFFATHPNGRFSKLAIIHAIDEADSQREIERAVTDLVLAGVLSTCTRNGVCYYRLTLDEPVRSMIIKTMEMDWRQWELVFQRV
jgi:hypothetical protein